MDSSIALFSFNLLDILLSYSIFFVTIFGLGIPLWKFLQPAICFGRLIESSYIGALGLLQLYLICWFLGILGSYTRASACIIFCLSFCSLYKNRYLLGRLFLNRPNSLFLTCHQLFPYFLLFLIPIALTLLTPIVLNGDSFYTFHVWAQQWGNRDDMSTYSFGSYSSFVTIIPSFLYKIRGTAVDILPNDRYVVSTFSAILAFLAMIITAKSILMKSSGLLGQIAGITIAILFLLILEGKTVVSNFRPEAYGLLFVSLIIYEIEMANRRNLESIKDLWRISILMGGLASVEGTCLVLSLLLFSFRFVIFNNHYELIRMPSLGMFHNIANRFLNGFLAMIIIGAIVLPYRVHQTGLANSTHYIHPSDHTFSAMTNVISAQIDDIKRKIFEDPGGFKKEITNACRTISTLTYDADVRMQIQRNNPDIVYPSVIGVLVFLGLFIGCFRLIGAGYMAVTVGYYSFWWIVSGRTQYSNTAHLSIVVPTLIYASASGYLWGASQLNNLLFLPLRVPNLFASSISLMFSFLCLKYQINNWGSDWNVVASKGVFLAQSERQRLLLHFPKSVDGIYTLRELYRYEQEPSDWKKLLISADHPWDRLLVNSFNPDHPHSPRNQGIDGKYTLVRSRQVPGAIQFGEMWISPARSLHRPARLMGNELKLISVDQSLVKPIAGHLLINARTKEVDAEQLAILLDAPLNTNESWSYQIDLSKCFTGEKVESKNAEVKHLYGVGAYGQEGWTPGLLNNGPAGSLGKWIGVPSKETQKIGECVAGEVVYRKRLHINKEKPGNISLGAFNSAETTLSVNNVSIMSKTSTWNIMDVHSHLFKDGDLLEIRTSNVNAMVFLEIDFQFASSTKYLGYSMSENGFVYHHLKQPFSSQTALESYLKMAIYIPKLAPILRTGTEGISYLVL